jgi:hypothetical protein
VLADDPAQAESHSERKNHSEFAIAGDPAKIVILQQVEKAEVGSD